MSALRVMWTLALPFVIQYCLAKQRLAPLVPFLLVGAALSLLMLKSRPAQTELQRVVSGFGPMLAASMGLGVLFVLCGLYFRDNADFALVLPALNNVAFLLVFAGSLVVRRPLVERFARLFHADLTAEEVVYCYKVTWLWMLFFLINITVILLLAEFGPLSWWTIYTGVLGYLVAGAVGLGEYVVRKYRFGRFTDRFHDRLLQRWLRAGSKS